MRPLSNWRWLQHIDIHQRAKEGCQTRARGNSAGYRIKPVAVELLWHVQLTRNKTGQFSVFDNLASGALKKVGPDGLNNNTYHSVDADVTCMTFISACERNERSCRQIADSLNDK